MLNIEFYRRPYGDAAIKNPHIIPLLFHNRWLGQDGLKRDLWLELSHGTKSTRDGEYITSRFHSLLWVNFEIGKETPFRKATICVAGEHGYESGRPLFAQLSVDLDKVQDYKYCEAILSPVPFGVNGVPQLPNVLGLRESISYLFKNNIQHEPMEEIIKRLFEVVKPFPKASPATILCEIARIGVSVQHEKFFTVKMKPERFRDIFQLDLNC